MDHNSSSNEYETWLEDVLPKHERLTAAVHSLLENMLQKDAIEFLSVTSRIKNQKGAVEKIKRKGYSEPKTQLTDLSGIRVVTFLEAQVVQISKIIRELFEIDEANSLDRSVALGLDKIGYRSTHFVCTLGKKREALPEYESLGGLKFEVQVRTVLQHAWAELAHDRSFKFGAALPKKIERKLNLYSGLLEIVDGAFDEISKEIDQYKHALDQKSIRQISGVEIDSISVSRFLHDIFGRHHVVTADDTPSPDVIDDIKRMQIKTIGDFEQLVTDKYIDAYKKQLGELGTATGFIRALLIYHDPDKYFQEKPGWSSIPRPVIEIIATNQKEDAIKDHLKKYKIQITEEWPPGRKRNDKKT